MAFRRYATAIFVFVIVVAAAFTVFLVADAAEDSAAQTADSVDNETINQQVDIWQFVSKATEDRTAGFNESVTVFNSSGDELTKGEDFLWNASEGTINYQNTANVTDGENGNISYTYFRNTKEVNTISQIIDPVVALIGNGGLLVGGLGLVVVLLAFVTLVARFFSGNDFQSNR